ncbi:benzoate transporter, partial [Acinetobacter baumannii]
MEFVHRFKPCNLAITTLFGLLTSSSLWAADTTQQSEDEWKFTLKNAYINRNFDNDALKDTGSWSQAASLFYKSKMYDTPLIIADKPITIGADASVQYAVRLSSDKHVADTVLPFNKETQSQASDFLKYGATLKLGYDKTLLSIGELWLDLPV